jgi:hypothetical protein
MILKKLTTLAATTAILMVLASCDSQPAAPTTPGVSNIGTPTPGDDIPISPADTATVPANATMTPGTLLTFNLSGGFAGFNTTLVLQDSGEYNLTKRGEQPETGKVEEAELTKIKQQLDAVRGLGDLKAEYDQGNVSDDFYRTITFDQKGTLKTVMVAEQGGRDITPVPVQQLMASINRLIETP